MELRTRLIADLKGSIHVAVFGHVHNVHLPFIMLVPPLRYQGLVGNGMLNGSEVTLGIGETFDGGFVFVDQIVNCSCGSAWLRPSQWEEH